MPPPFAKAKEASIKHPRFIQCTFIAECVSKIDEHIPQNFVAAPLLKSAMHRFVVRIALRQHVPLGTGVENPENGFENTTGGYRLAASAIGRNMLLRKMFPDASPLFVA